MSLLNLPPFPRSQKIYIESTRFPGLRLGMREVALTNGEKISLYDTSGPYTDPDAVRN